jgi:hypothetical protein
MKYLCFDTAINGIYTLLLLQKEYPTQQCLFQGTKDANIWDAAPWLFMAEDNPYDKIKDPIASLRNCVFFESTEKIDPLREHLQFFIYKTVKDNEYFFRFWDARVLIKYLSAGTQADLEAFFGDVIDSIYLDEENKENLLRLFINKKNKLARETVSKNDFFKTMAIQ